MNNPSVTQAMAYCHRAQSFDESCERILSKTRGALFFGVPAPTGTSTSWIGEYLNKVLGSEHGIDQSVPIGLATKFSAEFGELCQSDAEVFRDLSRSHGWSIFTLYESKRTVTRSGLVFVSILSVE